MGRASLLLIAAPWDLAAEKRFVLCPVTVLNSDQVVWMKFNFYYIVITSVAWTHLESPLGKILRLGRIQDRHFDPAPCPVCGIYPVARYTGIYWQAYLLTSRFFLP